LWCAGLLARGVSFALPGTELGHAGGWRLDELLEGSDGGNRGADGGFKGGAPVDESTADAPLRSLARGGRVSCKQALALAERLTLDPREVGRACDRLGLKIVSCRLGCFDGGVREPADSRPEGGHSA